MHHLPHFGHNVFNFVGHNRMWHFKSKAIMAMSFMFIYNNFCDFISIYFLCAVNVNLHTKKVVNPQRHFGFYDYWNYYLHNFGVKTCFKRSFFKETRKCVPFFISFRLKHKAARKASTIVLIFLCFFFNTPYKCICVEHGTRVCILRWLRCALVD